MKEKGRVKSGNETQERAIYTIKYILAFIRYFLIVNFLTVKF